MPKYWKLQEIYQNEMNNLMKETTNHVISFPKEKI